VQGLVGSLRLPCQFLASWLLGRQEDLHGGQRAGEEAQSLPQPPPGRSGVGRRGSHGLIMDAATVCRTAKEAREQSMHEQDIVDRVVLLLAAITRGLFSRVLGADDPPFRPVMGHRGDAGVAAGTAATGAGASSSGTTTVAASASEPPSRCARAVRERAGASPRVRSAASSAGKRP